MKPILTRERLAATQLLYWEDYAASALMVGDNTDHMVKAIVSITNFAYAHF